mmetsp:Transcript_33414/g.48912  ORF Transcript_33414/g.48912 Transcript_33414/m.48912 type:complete len:304 (+) Transcript_33414:123-1034(+)
MLAHEIHSAHVFHGFAQHPHVPPPIFHAPPHHHPVPNMGTLPAQEGDSAVMKTVAKPNITEDGHHQGRWTKKEHEAFLKGLQLYGREWKQISKTIPTRTSAQIRSHAQKYFQKLSKDGGSKPGQQVDHRRKLVEQFEELGSNKAYGHPVHLYPSGGHILPPEQSAHIMNTHFFHPRLAAAYQAYSGKTSCFDSPVIPASQCPGGFVRDQYHAQFQEWVKHEEKTKIDIPEAQESVASTASNDEDQEKDGSMHNLVVKCANKLKLNFDAKEMEAVEFFCSMKKRTFQQEGQVQDDCKRVKMQQR